MDEKTFIDRYQACEPELRSLYLELYPGREDAFEHFLHMLKSAWTERPATMKRLDEARERQPGWYKERDLLGMQLYVKAFAGTLQGVRGKLDYIESCGVNYLHLMPLLESPMGRSDGGYAVSDFRKVQPELGINCRNLPQVHTLVRMMRLACEIVCPGTLLLGEVVMEPSKVVPYFGSVERPECHMLYNVTTMASIWNTVATRDVRLLRHQLGQVFALPREYGLLNYLRCHDDIGWGLDYGFLGKFGIARRERQIPVAQNEIL